MLLSQRVEKLLPEIAKVFLNNNWKLVIAESCTGGLVASTVTSIPGSSLWFSYGLVSYSNEAKKALLDISSELLDEHGAESSACAYEMINGLFALDEKVYRVATTGFAGPSGEYVGLVFLAFQPPNKTIEVKTFHFLGTRMEVIHQSVYQVLREIILSTIELPKWPIKCFFALNMYEESLQRQCLSLGCSAGIPIEYLEPGNNLHLTLAYLGEVEQEHIQKLLINASEIQSRITPFKLTLEKIDFWKKSRALVLMPSDIPKELTNLVNLLGLSEAFKPHVTLAKRLEKSIHAQTEMINIPWEIKSFSLMISFHGVFYIEWKRWCLMAGNQNCSTQ